MDVDLLLGTWTTVLFGWAGFYCLVSITINSGILLLLCCCQRATAWPVLGPKAFMRADHTFLRLN